MLKATSRNVLKKVVVDGKVVSGYYIDRKGRIFSTKKETVYVKKVYYPKVCNTNPYPKVRLMCDGKGKNFLLHRLVCEAFIEIPIPKELEFLDWDNIPEKERNVILDFVSHAERYQVNHIDHDIYNFNADNLEWVSAKENQNKYQTHKKKVPHHRSRKSLTLLPPPNPVY